MIRCLLICLHLHVGVIVTILLYAFQLVVRAALVPASWAGEENGGALVAIGCLRIKQHRFSKKLGTYADRSCKVVKSISSFLQFGQVSLIWRSGFQVSMGQRERRQHRHGPSPAAARRRRHPEQLGCAAVGDSTGTHPAGSEL
jgi:hypothetical protein